jgi:hypothetical protein
VEHWHAVLATVEAALVEVGLGRPAPTLSIEPELQLAARCAIAAKFLAVSTPRTLAVINLGVRTSNFVDAQAAWAPAREVRSWSVGDSDRALADALAADIVIAAGPVVIPRRAIRGGTHLTALDRGVALDPELVTDADVHDNARLAAVVAGLVDGRQLDEITVLVCDG